MNSILLSFYRDINHCDPKGRSALHFVATSESVQARKMVSLLMKSGSDVGELITHTRVCLDV